MAGNLLTAAERLHGYAVELYDYYCAYPRLSKRFSFRVMSSEETLDAILSGNLSVSRYGDGELAMINGGRIGFQNADEKLAERLRQVLDADEPGHLNCVPECLLRTDGLSRRSKLFWGSYVAENYESLKRNVPGNRTYGDAQFTRFYVEYSDKSRIAMQKKIDNIRKLWGGGECYLIEGEYTRCGVGNDLLDNAKSVHRIICPATNAYNAYDKILETALEKIPKRDDVLVLCLLGPTATVLAYDLFKAGYQAIDMGHVDIEYEWFRSGESYKARVKGKAVNECGVNCPADPVTTPEYEKQIIAKVLT